MTFSGKACAPNSDCMWSSAYRFIQSLNTLYVVGMKRFISSTRNTFSEHASMDRIADKFEDI